jgi:hypothetical protein
MSSIFINLHIKRMKKSCNHDFSEPIKLILMISEVLGSSMIRNRGYGFWGYLLKDCPGPPGINRFVRDPFNKLGGFDLILLY